MTQNEIDAEFKRRMEEYSRFWKDRIIQGLNNNLWDNNPGELERWADDGGKE